MSNQIIKFERSRASDFSQATVSQLRLLDLHRRKSSHLHPFVLDEWDGGYAVNLPAGGLKTIWKAGWRRVGAYRTRGFAEQAMQNQLHKHPDTRYRIREIDVAL